MKLQAECVSCILGQAERVAQKIGANEALTQKIIKKAQEHSQTFSFSKTPPEVATPLYEALAVLADKKDLYDEAKTTATEQAKAMLPKLYELIEASSDTLHAAGKMSVAGNVIDLATQEAYDLTAEVHAVLDANFPVDHFNILFKKLHTAKSLAYFADNAGEHIFDAIFIKYIKDAFPHVEINYITRGNAIINDVTLEEALDSGLDRHAKVLSSGVPTPGFVFDLANEESQNLFLDADIVIAKGMGNFETMTENFYRDVFHLFKVKCDVVSRFVGHELGSLICMQLEE